MSDGVAQKKGQVARKQVTIVVVGRSRCIDSAGSPVVGAA